MTLQNIGPLHGRGELNRQNFCMMDCSLDKHRRDAAAPVLYVVCMTLEPAASIIRVGTVADAATLTEFGRRTFHDTFAADNDPDDMAAYLAEAFTPEQQAAELAQAECTCLLAEVDGVLAGMAYVIDRSPNEVVHGSHLVELQRFYVDTPWHGRGVARVLMTAVVETAQALDGDVLWLGVWERNARAIAFYRKQGFERVGAKTFRLGADVQTDDVMARAL